MRMDATNTPISVRPPNELRPRLRRIAEELGRSEGQVFNDAMAALVRLIDDPVPAIPQIVTMARTLREHRATMLDEARPFPSSLTLHEPPVAPASGGVADSAQKSKRARSRSAPESNGNNDGPAR